MIGRRALRAPCIEPPLPACCARVRSAAPQETAMTQAQDVEFIGMVQPREQSETHPPRGPAIDPGYLRASA